MTLLGDEASIYFQSGADAFDFVIPQIVLPLSTSELQEHNIEWYVTEISATTAASPPASTS